MTYLEYYVIISLLFNGIFVILVIYNDIENSLRYLISEDLDWLQFHNIVINSGNDSDKEDLLFNFLYDSDGNMKLDWLSFDETNAIDFSITKHLVNITWLP